jgi:hypothetical protein
MSPFFVDHDYHPRKGVEARYESKVDSTAEFSERLKKVRDEATAALEKAPKNMKKNTMTRNGRRHQISQLDRRSGWRADVPISWVLSAIWS